MTILTQEKISRFGGIEGLKKIYDNCPDGGKYYVHTQSDALGVFGFYTDKFIIGGPYKAKDLVKMVEVKRFLNDIIALDVVPKYLVEVNGNVLIYRGYAVTILADSSRPFFRVQRVFKRTRLGCNEYDNLESALKDIDKEVNDGKNT